MFGLNSTAKMKFFFDWDERGRKEMEESCGGRLPPLGHKDYVVHAPLFLVIDEVETLAAVEGEAGVGGDEGNAEGDGVGDDDVVGGVFMVHGGV